MTGPTGERRAATRVYLTVEFTADLAEWEVWPDGDAPPGWGAGDVAGLIAAEHGTVAGLIRDWALDTYATVEIGDDAGGRATVDYPGPTVGPRT